MSDNFIFVLIDLCFNDKGWNEGLDEGIDEGIDEGWNEGLDEGIDEGWNEGLDEGLDEGIDEGWNEGLDEGFNEGIDEGMEEFSTVFKGFVKEPAVNEFAVNEFAVKGQTKDALQRKSRERQQKTNHIVFFLIVSLFYIANVSNTIFTQNVDTERQTKTADDAQQIPQTLQEAQILYAQESGLVQIP